MISEKQENKAIDFNVVKDLESMIGGDAKHIIEAYLTMLDQTMPEINVAYNANKLEALRVAAHSLKSCSFQIGANKVGDLSRELELNAAAGLIDELDKLVESINNESLNAKKSLLEYIKQEH